MVLQVVFASQSDVVHYSYVWCPKMQDIMMCVVQCAAVGQTLPLLPSWAGQGLGPGPGQALGRLPTASPSARGMGLHERPPHPTVSLLGCCAGSARSPPPPQPFS